MDKKAKRSQSSATTAALEYWGKHPEKIAAEIARKFKIDITTVYRARQRARKKYLEGDE